MRNVLLFFFTISTSICVPIPADQPSERSDLIGLTAFVSKPSQERGYYPDFKQYGREQAVLEQEHWISKIDSVYNRAQNKAASYLNIKPLVDTIQEHEKYGNDGEQHRKFSRLLVNGFDALGNTINTAVDEVPKLNVKRMPGERVVYVRSGENILKNMILNDRTINRSCKSIKKKLQQQQPVAILWSHYAVYQPLVATTSKPQFKLQAQLFLVHFICHQLPFKAKNYAGKTINAALDAVGAQLVGI